MEKTPRCSGGTITGENTAQRHMTHIQCNVNQFTLTTIHNNVFFYRFTRKRQYRELRTSSTHRAELLENSLMVDDIRICAEVNLHTDAPAQSPIHFVMYVAHTKGHHWYPDHSIGKLGGWKHTTAFHKSFETPQTTLTLWKYVDGEHLRIGVGMGNKSDYY